PTGKVIKVNSSYFTVVGVIRKQSTAMAFSDLERPIIVPVSLAQQLFGRGDYVHMIALAGREDVASAQVEKACRQEIFARHIISPDDEKAIWTMAVSEMLDKIQGLFRGIALLTWIVGLGTLFAGIVGVSNIMLVTIKERTQEIGIRRAIGAPPAAILSQILSESFVLTFVAGVLGLAAAVGLLSAVDSVYYRMVVLAQEGASITWMVSFGTGIQALFIIVAGSLLAGIIPAFRALKIKAVDAIREE
ncbi:MAG: FtsX-like permease family protein, partial [Alistipes sp.]|nr:FtsX-like permease family protein [Alistipes sp.]